MTDERLSESDQREFQILDDYVRRLQGMQRDQATQIASAHPELSELLSCADALECLAPLSSPEVPASTGGANGEVLFELGRYEILAEIGRGGMGVVYRARQKDLGRVVALKTILGSQHASDDDIRRFHREAEAAGKLRHPNIVGIHEAGCVDGWHYFSMDYIEGTSLSQELKVGALDPEQAARLLMQVARAVEYLHENQIIHRDLKPGNILLDHTGRPFVTDFGLVKLFSDDSGHTQTGSILGTPSYMSPEQASGRSAEISAQSDVYSLGAILYEALTGRPPFRAKTPLDTLVEVLELEPVLPTQIDPKLPRDLELICLKCLDKVPARRYASAGDLADDLEHWLKREPIEARPANWRDRIVRWSRREPALASRLVGLGIAGTVMQIRWSIDGQNLYHHASNMCVLAAWALASVVFQRIGRLERWADFARFGWSALDVVLLTMLLNLALGPIAPLFIAYPLLIVTSGLFFQTRLVHFTTALCLIAWIVLLLLRPDESGWLHYDILWGVVLVVIGRLVAFQVHRVRTLSRYYERSLPE